MHWIWWVVILIMVFLILLPFAKIKVSIEFFHNQDNDDLKIKISTFFGIASYKIDVPVLKVDDDSPSIIVEEEQHTAISDKKKTKKITPELILRDLQKIKDFLQHVIGFHKIIKRFLNHISINQFTWKSRLGIEDAAATGPMIGAAWGIKGSTLGVISHYMRLKVVPNIDIQPAFQQVISHTELTCMISFRLGYAIIAALQIVKHWKNRPKFTVENLERNGT